METPRATGRLHIPDERDGQFLMARVPRRADGRPTGREYMYWRNGPVLDQGSQPHCVAFAWKQWLQCSPIRQGRFLMEDFVYELAQKRDQWPGEGYDGTSVRAGAKVLRALGFVSSFHWAFNAADVASWVLDEGPVVMGTTWTYDMFFPDEDGFVAPTGENCGGHAYLCVGYNRSRGVFKLVNSWGRDWGRSGSFWMKASDLATLIRQQGEACTAIERRV